MSDNTDNRIYRTALAASEARDAGELTDDQQTDAICDYVACVSSGEPEPFQVAAFKKGFEAARRLLANCASEALDDNAEKQQAYDAGYQHGIAHVQYTAAMGEAATAYFDTFKNAHPLPSQFRWSEVYDAMTRASEAAPPIPDDLASMTRMFHAACADLGAINETLGLDPDDGGAEPILEAIAELKRERDQWVDAQFDAAASVVAAPLAVGDAKPLDPEIEIDLRERCRVAHLEGDDNIEVYTHIVLALLDHSSLASQAAPVTQDAATRNEIEIARIQDYAEQNMLTFEEANDALTEEGLPPGHVRPIDIAPDAQQASETVAYLVTGLDGYGETYRSTWIKQSNAEACAAGLCQARITPLIAAPDAAKGAGNAK